MHQDQIDLILPCIVSLSDCLCIWSTLDQTSTLQSTLSEFMVDPRRVHWTAAKHILRYIKGTVEYGLAYDCWGSVQLAGFTDADWEGCVEDQKSTLGCCFSIGLGVVSWFSRKQKSVALSSAEVEYMAASMVACEGMSLMKLLSGLFECELGCSSSM